MPPKSTGRSIIYRSGINPKIQRIFAVFCTCDFIARPPAGQEKHFE